MTTLTGTPKQIACAQDIRAQALQQLAAILASDCKLRRDLMSFHPHYCPHPTMDESVFAATLAADVLEDARQTLSARIEAITEAKWFLENRPVLSNLLAESWKRVFVAHGYVFKRGRFSAENTYVYEEQK
jgi:hypothetical protein